MASPEKKTNLNSSDQALEQEVGQRKMPPRPGPNPLGLDDVKRPYEAIIRLHDALLPFATPYKQKPNRTLPAYQHTQGIIWLVTTGNLTFYRAHDDLKIITSKGPILTGLAEIFQPLGRTYYRISRGATVSWISSDEAKKIFDEKALWREVAEVLTYITQMMVYRDEHLVTKHSYTMIRAKIMEYSQKKEANILQNERTGIVAYIQNTTYLSRSLIYHVLSDLCEGGYIKISNGKLLEVNKLPENY